MSIVCYYINSVYSNIFRHSLNYTPRVSTCAKCLRASYSVSSVKDFDDEEEEEGVSGQRSISKAMKAYRKRSIEHEKFMMENVASYEIGKRHLANMMGENPETFSQDDIDKAIAYLLPSALYEPRARPFLKHPSEIFATQKEAQFDASGRPLHSMFYTGRPRYYSLLQEIASKSLQLNKRLAASRSTLPPHDEHMFDGSKWVEKHKFEEIISEKVTEEMFENFINSMERLMKHPLIESQKEFVLKFRRAHVVDIMVKDIPALCQTAEGRSCMTATGKRKKSMASVTVFGEGSGHVRINGQDILYFENLQERLQVMFPLQITGNLDRLDVEAEVEGGGKSSQAGAIRYAIATALRSFVSAEVVERMRLAGLLTLDARKEERKKPGRRKARAKFTWKKR